MVEQWGRDHRERRYREALEQIAERPCQAPDEHPSKVGECPDYWAIGMSKEACPPCIARQALADQEPKR